MSSPARVTVQLAVQSVVIFALPEGVVARAAFQSDLAAVQNVIARAATDDVSALFALDVVIYIQTTHNQVVASSASQIVLA